MLFHITDPSPGISLENLPPGALRIRSWASRAAKLSGFPVDQEVQIFGGIGIVAGLEYHNQQFMLRVQSLSALTSRLAEPFSSHNVATRLPTREEFNLLETLHHEVVAYLNRAGQLFYFAKALGREAMLTELETLLPFRHKHSAHRSIDLKQGESPDDLQSQAMAFGFTHNFQNGYPVFQLHSENNRFTFDMRLVHPNLVGQATALFEAILPLPNDV